MDLTKKGYIGLDVSGFYLHEKYLSLTIDDFHKLIK